MLSRRPRSNGPAVSTIELGCVGMPGTYGLTDRTKAIMTIHAVLVGITLLDTGNFYGIGHNELLLHKA